ncbi:putative cyclooxygese [Daphnia sinensis]|uniref:prostaglandin-endoperoxide synthase n=1 Tax=Daphnia sinensis TaxID=1820382 RepID=A0AAD5L080_9CRUS|nr:putative cyclooxygese [Daphnia sinensis]
MNSLRLALILVFTFYSPVSGSTEGFDPCCSFPCQNQGVCMSTSNHQDFTCDCTGLEYYGKTCETPYLGRRLKNWLRPSLATMHQLYTGWPWLWKIVNNVPFLHRAAMRYVYMSRGAAIDSPPRFNSGHDYITTESHFNTSYYARSLPPVPQHCPTPMGVAGHKELPDVNVLAERFFKRKEFIAEPHGTNILFAYYAQHFSHQFFRTDRARGAAFTKGNDGVDVSHIYGLDKGTQDALRSFSQGKMKVRMTDDGQQFPPLLRDAPGVHMIYPPHTPQEERVALGHALFSMQPGLFVMSTIWLREHNRICDILRAEHPSWDDERLYQTAKLIVLAENLKITIEEYVQHLSQYKIKLTYDPELLRDQPAFQFSNRIHVEFAHLYHWHPMAPDAITVDNSTYTLEQMSFSTKAVTKHGLASFVEAIATQPAGALSHSNHGAMLLDQFKDVVLQGRQLRLQSFNNYRMLFGMPKYTSFMELTGGDVDMSRQLQLLYGHIDALEFYPGMLLEKSEASVTPFTMVNIGGPYAVKGMMANPISSPQYWKPSTFGGEVGFNIVKTTTIRQLFCRNMEPGECGHIGFHLPEEQQSVSVASSKGNANHVPLLEPSPVAHYATHAGSDHSFSSKTFSPPAAGMTSTHYATNYRPLTVDDLDFVDCQQSASHTNNYCRLREAHPL